MDGLDVHSSGDVTNYLSSGWSGVNGWAGLDCDVGWLVGWLVSTYPQPAVGAEGQASCV